MLMDVKGFPVNKTWAEHIGSKISNYVRTAEFIDSKGIHVFRMILDPDMSERQLRELLGLHIMENGKTYKMSTMECIRAPVEDDDRSPHQKCNSIFLKVTFIS